MHRSIGPTIQICRTSGLPSARYRGCTKLIFISKGSYDNGEPKNVFLVSVQIAHLAVRTVKITRIHAASYMAAVRICGISELTFAILPCLHQTNIYIKRKLRQRGVQKCILCFSANSPPRGTDLQNYPESCRFVYGRSANTRVFGPTFRHGTVFAPN